MSAVLCLQSVSSITIIRNDNPGGFISFDSSFGTSFTVMVSSCLLNSLNVCSFLKKLLPFFLYQCLELRSG